MQTRVFVLVAAVVGAACSRDDRTAHAPAGSPKVTHVIEIKSSVDLEKLGLAYLEAIEAGTTGVFEVHVAPGTYQDTRWQLTPAHGARPPELDIVLRGEGAAIPGPSQLSGRAIRIEGLVLTSQRFAPIVVEATKSIAIAGCAFIDGRLTDENLARPYLDLRARGAGSTKTPVTAEIANAWFVRNFEAAEHSALVGFSVDEREPGYFDTAAIRDSAFLGNAFSSDVAIAYTRAAVIERSVFYKTWGAGKFVSCRTSGGVKLTDSVMVAESIGHLAEVADCPPIEASTTKVYARDYTPASKPPPGLRGAAFADRTAIDAHAQVIDDAIKAPVAMPSAAQRQAVVKALRP